MSTAWFLVLLYTAGGQSTLELRLEPSRVECEAARARHLPGPGEGVVLCMLGSDISFTEGR